MKSLERRFRHLEDKHPLWSSYTCFAVAVLEVKYSRKTIGYWFYQLVRKEDYAKRDERSIMDCLENSSGSAEDGSKLW